MNSLRLLLLAIIVCSSPMLRAQDASAHNPRTGPRFYLASGYDFAMLSSAFIERRGSPRQLAVPRFTAFNIGLNLHYDPGSRFGLYSGIGIRNLGFIENIGDVTIKRRVYAASIPVGVKFGRLYDRNFFLAGGGMDIPFNYREKAFVNRGDKTKFNEWFSDRTPAVLPFIFLGKSWSPGVTIKLQYYPRNFLNDLFIPNDNGLTTVSPYDGYNVNILAVSLGIDIHYGQYKIQEREYQLWKRRKLQTAGAN